MEKTIIQVILRHGKLSQTFVCNTLKFRCGGNLIECYYVNDNELGEEKSISLKLEFNFGYF